MNNFYHAVELIVAGAKPAPEDLEGLSPAERQILCECEAVGCQKGFFKTLLQTGENKTAGEDVSRGRIESLAADLLDICRLESGELQLEVEEINLKNIILECMEEFHEEARAKNIKFVARLDSHPLLLYADRRYIKRIPNILFSNALKFTPEGGRVDILAKGLPQEIIVSVIDNGIGIEPAGHKKVFERFGVPEACSDMLKGFGVYLNLVKLLVDAHGGKIWVESGKNRGSNFSFCLYRHMQCDISRPKKIESLFP